MRISAESASPKLAVSSIPWHAALPLWAKRSASAVTKLKPSVCAVGNSVSRQLQGVFNSARHVLILLLKGVDRLASNVMDPVTLATITSAVTVLANECAKEIAGEAGKAIWDKVKSSLGWNKEPPMQDIPERIAHELQSNPQLASQIVDLLKSAANASSAKALVSNLKAEKVVVAGTIDVKGNFTM